MNNGCHYLFKKWLEAFLGASLSVDETNRVIYSEISDIRYEIGFHNDIRVYFPFDDLEKKVHLAMKEDRIKRFLTSPFTIRPYGFDVQISFNIFHLLPAECASYLEFIQKISKELMEFFLEEKVKTLMIAKALKGK